MSSGAIERDVNFCRKIESRQIEKGKTPKRQKAERENLIKFPADKKKHEIITMGLLSNRHEWLTTRDQCVAETAVLPRSPGFSWKSSERWILLQ
jgi:hypothetical protein